MIQFEGGEYESRESKVCLFDRPWKMAFHLLQQRNMAFHPGFQNELKTDIFV